VDSFLALWPGYSLLRLGGAEAYRLTLYLSLIATAASLLPLTFVTEAKAAKGEGIGSQLGIYHPYSNQNCPADDLFYCLYGIGWGASCPISMWYFVPSWGQNANQKSAIFFSISQVS
jgi:hypothetical protein